jgi:hypothetical protein
MNIREDIRLSVTEVLNAPHCKVVARLWNPVAFVMATSSKWSAL